MCASDVTATLDRAVGASGLDHITVAHRPRLLSDYGPSYVADDLATCLAGLERQVRAFSNTTIMFAIMRAWTTSRLPMSSSAGQKRSSQNANASSLSLSQTAARSISCRPLKL